MIAVTFRMMIINITSNNHITIIIKPIREQVSAIKKKKTKSHRTVAKAFRTHFSTLAVSARAADHPVLAEHEERF